MIRRGLRFDAVREREPRRVCPRPVASVRRGLLEPVSLLGELGCDSDATREAVDLDAVCDHYLVAFGELMHAATVAALASLRNARPGHAATWTSSAADG